MNFKPVEGLDNAGNCTATRQLLLMDQGRKDPWQLGMGVSKPQRVSGETGGFV